MLAPNIPHTLKGIPSGVDGTRATLSEMVRFVRQYKKDMKIVDLARRILTQEPIAKKLPDQIKRLQQWVRDKITYVQDPHNGPEMVQTPVRTLDIGTGDCDDKAVLLAALLASIGIPARFRAVGFNDGPYSHVLVQAKCGKGWIDLETILDGVEAGWAPPNTTRNMVAHV